MMYLKLFSEFFKIGLFSVGGGLATLPFLQALVSKYGWITSEELVNMIAISESTPGPIGVNAATLVGNNMGGVLGGLVAVLGLMVPSVTIILIIAHYFSKFSERHIVKSAFYGIRPAVAGLIGAAGFEVIKITLINVDKYFNTKNLLDFFNIKGIMLFIIMLYLIDKYKKHPIVYIIVGAIVGVVFKF